MYCMFCTVLHYPVSFRFRGNSIKENVHAIIATLTHFLTCLCIFDTIPIIVYLHKNGKIHIHLNCIYLSTCLESSISVYLYNSININIYIPKHTEVITELVHQNSYTRIHFVTGLTLIQHKSWFMICYGF
jgi:hypothetical protein